MESINMFGGMNSDLSSFIQNTEKYLKALKYNSPYYYYYVYLTYFI